METASPSNPEDVELSGCRDGRGQSPAVPGAGVRQWAGPQPDRRASLLTSLLLVKRDYRYSRVLFWGRILGLVADYYIAQGLSEDQLALRKTLYSLNCMEWSLLPPATDEMMTQTSVVKGRFMGDPSHEYEYTELQKVNEGDKVFEEEIVIRIKEETRLVSIIDQIDKAVAIIPRGALLRVLLDPPMSIGPLKVSSLAPRSWAGGHLFLSIVRHICGSLSKTAHFLRKERAVTPSVGGMCPVTWHRSFHVSGLPAFSHLPPHWPLLIAGSGPNLGGGNTIPSSPFSSVRLTLSEAKKLSSYFHFREPVDLKNKTLLEKADLDPSLDFMDSLEHDIPKGSWSIQMERGNALVVLRSLLWPGLTFYHAPGTKNCGYIYVGTGEKNMDLPFML
ncbi:hypothetical protein QTO34_001480 [Cnephaeus nilssonii]|uniref:Radial spoke head protein 9 homolog n=1 Tax=Cnephaeus nilssonii TaxID=3371016 RepID=A0AA40HVY3_CNENI|nr:hypothetical protein QTO34_001480 [Eptesicus nilssonii]